MKRTKIDKIFGWVYFTLIEAVLVSITAFLTWGATTQVIWPGHNGLGRALTAALALVFAAGAIEAVREECWNV